MPSQPTNFCSRWGWHLPSITLSSGVQCAALLLMAIYIWFLPVGHTIAIRHLAFFSLILLTVWSAWRYKLQLQFPLRTAWLAYAAIALLSLAYAIDPAYSRVEIQQEIGYGVLALLIGASWITNSHAFSNLIRIIMLGMLLMVGYALYNGVVITPFWHERLPQIRSLNNGVGTFSTYLITTIPFLIVFTWLTPAHKRTLRIALVLLLTGSIGALFLTGNRMGFLALGIETLIGGALLFTFRGSIGYKPVMTAIVLVCIAAGSFIAVVKIRTASQNVQVPVTAPSSPVPVVEDERIQIWRVVAANIKAQPWTGGGFGIEAFKMRNPEFVRLKSLNWHAHNMLLNKGVQMGIPGMLLFLALFGAALHAVWPTQKLLSRSKPMWAYAVAGSAMIVGMFVKNMTDDFFTNDPALLFWLIIGALITAIHHERQNTSPIATPDYQK